MLAPTAFTRRLYAYHVHLYHQLIPPSIMLQRQHAQDMARQLTSTAASTSCGLRLQARQDCEPLYLSIVAVVCRLSSCGSRGWHEGVT